VLAWVDQIVQWDFQQVIPCHFEAPVAATPEMVYGAFDFLRRPDDQSWSGFDHRLPMGDLATLGQIDRQLTGGKSE